MMDDFLILLKNELFITYDDTDTDKRLLRILENAGNALNYKIGGILDYSQGMEQELLLGYCVYVWNNIGYEFDNAYFNEIMQLRQKYEVLQLINEEQQEDEDEDEEKDSDI